MHNTIVQELDEHHQKILDGIEEIRGHCDLPAPDTVGLGKARLRLTRASAARSRFVRDKVMPRLQRLADPEFQDELIEIQHLFNERRMESSRHIREWNARGIVEDWTGYRHAAREICSMMEEQIGRERTVLRAHLKQL